MSETDVNGSLETRLAVAELLPTHIRLAVRDTPEEAPAMLADLIQLTSDQAAEVASLAALGLISLGDWEGKGFNSLCKIAEAMRANPSAYSGADRNIEKGFIEVLRSPTDEQIARMQSLALKELDERAANTTLADIGASLERAGHSCGPDYWAARVQQGRLVRARDAVELAKGGSLTAAMQERYPASRKDERIWLAGELAARTGEPQYLDAVKASYRGNESDSSGWSEERKAALLAMAKVDIAQTLPEIQRLLVSESDSLGYEFASKALLKANHPEAAKLLHESSLAVIAKQRFPSPHLEALVLLNTPEADALYEDIKAKAKDPKRGFGPAGAWFDSDFEVMEDLKETRGPGKHHPRKPNGEIIVR